MPRRPLPVFVLSVGLALMLGSALRPLFAQGKAAPAAPDSSQYPEVTIQPVEGDTVKGRLKLSAVSVETRTGTTTVQMQHVKQIAINSEPDGKANDAVTLADKSVVHGRVMQEEFVVERPGLSEPQRIKKSEVREIRVVRKESLPLVSILLGLLTLTAMEIVLGVDNIIFLAIVAGRLPKEQQPKARRLGLIAALGTRLLLLGSLFLLLKLTAPLFTLPTLGIITDIEAREVSGRDLILLIGGLFLVGKSTYEIHEKMEHARASNAGVHHEAKPASFAWTIATIAVIDIVFSLDSVITAIGMVEQIWVMMVAVVLAMLVMLYFAGPIANFVDRHPTIKVLALAFLILIGVMLVAEGLGQHIDKGYIYVAMAFALVVEVVNMRLRGHPAEGEPVGLKASETEATRPEPPA